MITQLPIKLAAKAAEPGFSLLARNASANAGRSALEFCAIIGLSKQGICAGQTKDLNQFAHLTGSDPKDLINNSPNVLDRKTTLLSGCRFLSRSIRKQDMVVCPACWLEQREVSDAKAYEIALRREWLPRPVTSCALHSLRLIELPYWDYTTTYDHLRRSGLDCDWESRLADRSQRQTPTNFETLAIRQLSTGQPICNWLPDEQIDVLERWCFGLGILLEKGASHPRATAKSDEPRYIEVGLSATIAGKDNLQTEIDAALRRHRMRLPSTWLAAWSYQNPKPTERQNFARLFRGLCDDQGFFCLNAATDQLPRQIEFEMGLKKIAKIAGKTPLKIRQALVADKLVPESGIPHQHSIYMLLRKCEAHIGALERSLSERGAARYLGVGTALFKGLVRDNVVVPLKTNAFSKPKYDNAVLTKLMDELVGAIESRSDNRNTEATSLHDVCFLLRCPASRLLSLVSSGQLTTTSLSSNGTGLDRLRFNLDEVKICFADNDAGGLSVEELRLRLGLQHRHVTKLAKLGLLPSYLGRKKETGISAALVDETTLNRFLRKYQTARTWSQSQGIAERIVRRRLQERQLPRAREGDGIPIFRIRVISRL